MSLIFVISFLIFGCKIIDGEISERLFSFSAKFSQIFLAPKYLEGYLLPRRNTGLAEKKMNKTFSYKSGCLAVIIRLLFTRTDALWQWHQRKRIVILVYCKMAQQRENRVKVSALLRAGHKVSEVANLVGVTRTTVYAINKRMGDGESVSSRVGSGRKTGVDRDSLRDAIRSSPRS